MRPFHLIIQRYDPPEEEIVETIELDGRTIAMLRIEPGQLNGPLPVSFDDVLDRLAALPRMFTEPDGSFVWVGQDDSDVWQLDGQLHDGATGLMNVEVKGTASYKAWKQMLGCLGLPGDRVVFQLVREGVFVDSIQLECMTWPEE